MNRTKLTGRTAFRLAAIFAAIITLTNILIFSILYFVISQQLSTHLKAHVAIAPTDNHALAVGLDQLHPIADLKFIHSDHHCFFERRLVAAVPDRFVDQIGNLDVPDLSRLRALSGGTFLGADGGFRGRNTVVRLWDAFA